MHGLRPGESGVEGQGVGGGGVRGVLGERGEGKKDLDR